MTRLALLTTTLLLLMLALSQEDEGRRIISIDSSGGTQSGNLRFGPIYYEHPDPEGITATVSTLTIYGQRATLAGPEGEQVSLTEARGRRSATFEGGVRVTRGRLEARGPDLGYSEATGLGTLQGGVEITVAPREEGDDPVYITAGESEFDVDNDVSVSRGDVRLVTGGQSAQAEQLIFEEERDLGCLSSEGAQVEAQRLQDDGDEITITADEICTLTDQDMLLARGNVVIRDGDITSQGDTVFFDDRTSRALILGNPAVSENAADGIRTTGAVIEQRTDIDAVRVYSDPVDFDEAAFALSQRREP
jgi:lipopolysaccharide export system protein LptA